MMKYKLIPLFLLILIVNSTAQKNIKSVVFLSITYGVLSGLEEGYRTIDRQNVSFGQYQPSVNKLWHQLKIGRQLSGIVLGIVIGKDSNFNLKIILKNLLLSGSIFWVTHDLLYNRVVYPNKSLFYSSKNSESKFEKFTYLKIPSLVLSISVNL